jgi:hypothetical protein
MSVAAANFGHQVNVSSHLAAKNFSYAKPIEITNFNKTSQLICFLVLVSADEDTAVGRPSMGGHFQVFEPSSKGSVMVSGDFKMPVLLAAGSTQTIHLGFCPGGTDAQTYKARLQLFVGSDPIEHPGTVAYLDIEATGVGSNAAIFFDRNEVVLPLVPVGVTAKSTLYLLNHGFDNLYVKYLFPEGLGYTIVFPEGQVLSS